MTFSGVGVDVPLRMTVMMPHMDDEGGGVFLKVEMEKDGGGGETRFGGRGMEDGRMGEDGMRHEVMHENFSRSGFPRLALG